MNKQTSVSTRFYAKQQYTPHLPSHDCNYFILYQGELPTTPSTHLHFHFHLLNRTHCIKMGILDLEGHLVFYRSYHFNQTNVAIHLFCIPIILLSTIAFFSPVEILGMQDPYVNLGAVLAWGYGLFYVILDWQLGIPTMTILVAAAYVFKNIYLNLDDLSPVSQGQFVQLAIALHIFSWFSQFYGHGFHEKRAPALSDNLLQALVLAPFFVSFEVAFWLGYRLDLKKNIDNRAGKRNRDIMQKEKVTQKTN